MCCYLDDPDRQLDEVDTCELVVVAQVKYMVNDSGGLNGENIVGEGSNPGSDPGSAGVVDRVGQVPVEDFLDGLSRRAWRRSAPTVTSSWWSASCSGGDTVW